MGASAVTYHAGLMLAAAGGVDREPRLTCNGCGVVHHISPRKPAPQWLLNNKAPRGWRREPVVEPVTNAELPSKHYCPRCK